ncbi:MAG: class sortase [Solirubrobacterales bacterium]|nr:class sortase [Solirubrobacterales bacterium]
MHDFDAPFPAAGPAGVPLDAALADATDRLEQAAARLGGLGRRVNELLVTVDGLHAAVDASDAAAADAAARAGTEAAAAEARVVVVAAERRALREAARTQVQVEAEEAAARAVTLRRAADDAVARVQARQAALLERSAEPDLEPATMAVPPREPEPARDAASVAHPRPHARLRPPGRRGPLRSGRRPGVLPAVLFAAGAVAVADAVVTVVWQEPFTRLYASREQAELRGQLKTLQEQAVLPAIRLAPRPADRTAQLATALGRKAAPGSALGRVVIPSIDARFVMVQGTGEASLRRGPGHYTGTAMPGQRGTVGVAGHRTTYLAPFRRINELAKGATVRLEMPYGTFVYRVAKTRIVLPSEGSVLAPTSRDQLVLTACHPLYSAARRIVVTARLVRAVPKGASLSRAGGGAAAVPPRPA